MHRLNQRFREQARSHRLIFIVWPKVHGHHLCRSIQQQHLGQHDLRPFHLLDDDSQAFNLQHFFLFRHAFEGVVDQPGEGFGFDVVQVDAQQAFHLEQRRVATHQQFARLVGENAAFGLAVFVLDIADQHFQHVFHGQVTDDLAVGFLYQSKVRAAFAELLQQLRQRHMARYALQRAGQLGQVERLGDVVQSRQFQQQVLDVQQADKLVAHRVIHRVAAELVAAEQREDFLERGVEVEGDKVFARVGPVHHFQFANFHGGGEYTHALVARVLATAGVQDQLEFFTAVMVLMVRARLALAGNTQDGVCAGVEQVNRRVHRPVEQVQRHRGPQRQQLGFADGPGFRRQFTYHDVQVGDHKEGGKERHALDHFRRLYAHRAQQRLEDMRKSWLTDPAQAQGGQGDTQLAGRQVGVELAVHGAQDLPTPAVLVGDGLDPGGAQFDHGKFRRNEETVEQYQDQCKKNHAEVGEERSEGDTRGRVHDGVLQVPCVQ